MLSDYRTLVADLIRDDAANVAQAELDRAIIAAVARYSKDRARVSVDDMTPTDAYTIALPPAWEADISDLISVEYPVGERPPTLLDPARVYLYQSPSTTVIKSEDALSTAADSVRVSFTISHQVTALVDTIALKDREPVACWAAATLCDQLAALYSGSTDSTLQADSVQGQSRAQEYARRASGLRKRYFNELGIDDKRAVAAGVVVNLDRADSRGQDRLTHERRWR